MPSTVPLLARPCTIEQLQLDGASHFGQRPCWWQSEVAFQLMNGKNLVSISATGSGKSPHLLVAHVVWGWTYIDYCPTEEPRATTCRWVFSEGILSHITNSRATRQIPKSVPGMEINLPTQVADTDIQDLGDQVYAILNHCPFPWAGSWPSVHAHLEWTKNKEKNKLHHCWWSPLH